MVFVQKKWEILYYFVGHFKQKPESYSKLSEISKSFLEEKNQPLKANEQIKWDKEIKIKLVKVFNAELTMLNIWI